MVARLNLESIQFLPDDDASYQVIPKGNTCTVRAKGLTDEDGVAVTDATVVLEALVGEDDGSQVANVSASLSMPHDEGGDYDGTIGDDAGVVPGRWYLATVLATSGSVKGRWTERVRCKTRRA